MQGRDFLFITNFKTYKEATGERAQQLLDLHAKVAADFPRVCVSCAVQALDFSALKVPAGVELLAQHTDPACPGSYTGQIVPQRVAELGATGTILNHSENRMSREHLQMSIEFAKQAGLITVVCCETAEEGQSFLELDPDYLAVEPPELIGGDISVSKAQADLIKNALNLIGGEKLLVGAGVKDGEDVRLAVEYGARGVLVASGVCKSDNPEQALRDLLSGFPG